MTSPADASARITLVEHPIASPGCCAICGKNEHPKGFAATSNFDFEFYGTVYFCADCVGDYARLFGYLSPDDFVKLREHIEAQNAELNTLRASVSSLESTVDSVTAELNRRSAVPPAPVDTSLSVSDLVSSPVDEPDAELPEPVVAESDQISDQPELDFSEHANESRSDDLHGTSAADELLGL